MKKLSEFSLIERIKKRVGKYKKPIYKGIGDDAAVIKINKNKCLLYTCDSLVSGIHFSEKHTTPYQIGRKAAAVNISDIAAMGGKPDHCLVSLFLPKETTKKFVDGLYKGLSKECNLYDIDIIGGNISKSKQFIIDLFLTGEASPEKVLFRSGAQPGDAVLVTGTLGDSAMGLKFIPTPRVTEAILIAQSGKATSMIDISDGLSSDIGHICDESKVGVKIYLEKLPISKGVDKKTALNGGEDYELCFTVPEKYVNEIFLEFEKKSKTKVTKVGEILPKKQGKWLIDKDKKIPLKAKGWDHFL